MQEFGFCEVVLVILHVPLICRQPLQSIICLTVWYPVLGLMRRMHKVSHNMRIYHSWYDADKMRKGYPINKSVNQPNCINCMKCHEMTLKIHTFIQYIIIYTFYLVHLTCTLHFKNTYIHTIYFYIYFLPSSFDLYFTFNVYTPFQIYGSLK